MTRMRFVLGCLSAWLAPDLAPAATLPRDVPLPPRREPAAAQGPVRRPAAEMQGPPAPATRPPVAAPPAAAPAATAPPAATTPALGDIPPAIDPAAVALCDRLLASGTVTAERPAPVEGSGTPSGCGIPAPVRVSGITLADGRSVRLQPPALLGCAFAAGFADWVRQDLAPLLASRGGGLAALTGTGGYECRDRNRIPGAKRSEHAVGNAIDIRAFVLADHAIADITKTAADKVLFAQVKVTACARFMTVLGPGSDGYHEDNLHLDLQYRRNGAHYCHWQLPP